LRKLLANATTTTTVSEISNSDFAAKREDKTNLEIKQQTAKVE
jgi:hypothetical protein